ncbi:hypothetical protein QBC40DRAFT_59488 [Triangularia verruculosa]|uniref:Uncharacterized protein n=1 Tax=Triangularia verruculosa TaxID=2587418 RepID=A0AAN6XJ06_9PEZI|nr:hypothetical protein QBC40DRAFT_59488 [Triangularia verruculosa]
MGDYVWTMGFAAAHAVLAGIWITPLLILWFVSLCVVRRRGDPARVGVAWLKAACPFWILSMLCQVVQVGLNIWSMADPGSRDIQSLGPTIFHLFHAARALQNISDILLFVTFIELGSGFVFCLNGGVKTAMQRYTRCATFSWAVILLTLAIILLVMRAKDEVYLDRLTRTGRVHNTLNVCLWITSFPALVFASYVVHKSKGNIMLKKAATLYLVSTMLTFCRLLVTMAIYISEYRSFTVLGLREDIAYTDILTPILPTVEAFVNFVFMFIVLALLFIVVIRKRRGLWSKSQTTSDASNKPGNLTTNPSRTSETPCYSDDGLQEHGFCLQPVQAEPSSPPTDLQSTREPRSSSTEPPSPISSQQEAAVGHQTPPPVSPHGSYRIPRRPLPASVPRSPTESDLASDSLPSPQETRQLGGGFLGRQRTIEELEAQKVLILEGRPIHHASRTSLDDEEAVADGFQMQGHQQVGAGRSLTNAAATRIQTRGDHDPILEESTGLAAVVDGFQMQTGGPVSHGTVDDVTAAKLQKVQGHEDPVGESDVVADGFQMQIPGSSELPSYDEAGGETSGTKTRLGYLREKDDQDKKARGRARSF